MIRNKAAKKLKQKSAEMRTGQFEEEATNGQDAA
jgi:hypothetical protein